MHGKRNTVVPKCEPLTEEAFRQTWLVTLARLCREHGDSRVAMWLGVSERHLRNIKAGDSIPAPFRLWNLLAHDASAHDELDGEYGLKNVSGDMVCSNDPLTLDMIALAHETAEHEHPGSHGGQSTTCHELNVKDEARLRRVHRAIGTWLDRLDRGRKGLRVVGE